MTRDSHHFDVIVVGGGPAGSVASWMVAGAGFRVLMLEAAATPRRKVCGEFLGYGGIATLHQIGLSAVLSENIFPAARGAKIVTPGGLTLRGYFPQALKPTLGWMGSGGLSLNRQWFDRSLLQHAQQAGTQVVLGQRVTQLVSTPLGWQITTSGHQAYTCDLLIGADGVQSVVARALSLTLPQRKKRLALRCFLPTRSTTHGHLIEMHLLAQGSYIGLDFVSDEFVNLSIVADQAVLKAHQGAAGLIRHAFATYPKLQENMILPERLPEMNAISPVSHQVRSCIAQNAVLIGDAGGFTEPLTGDGITIALWTASTLAHHLIQCKLADRWTYRNQALRAYAQQKNAHYGQKNGLSKILYGLIRHSRLCDSLSCYLQDQPHRVNGLMGMINNTYQPFEGIRRMLLPDFLFGQEQAEPSLYTPRPDFDSNQTVIPYSVAAPVKVAK